MTEKRRAMVDEILEWANIYRNDHGRQPSPEEIDDFLNTWRRDK